MHKGFPLAIYFSIIAEECDSMSMAELRQRLCIESEHDSGDRLRGVSSSVVETPHVNVIERQRGFQTRCHFSERLSVVIQSAKRLTCRASCRPQPATPIRCPLKWRAVTLFSTFAFVCEDAPCIGIEEFSSVSENCGLMTSFPTG